MFICLFGLTFNLTRFLELKHVWYEVPIEEDDAANSESQVIFSCNVESFDRKIFCENCLKLKTSLYNHLNFSHPACQIYAILTMVPSNTQKFW